jgi:hypothetical protein
MILRKMAEKWSEVAAATTHPELRECYAERAAHFARLAAAAEREGRNGKVPSQAEPDDNG